MAHRQTPPKSADQAVSQSGVDQSTTISTHRGGIDVFDSLWVRQPIRPGKTEAVSEFLATWADRQPNGDIQTVLPVTDVTLATLFLDRREAVDELIWYLEVADDKSPEWTDPGATVRAAPPLFDAGLDEFLSPESTVHIDGARGHQLVTHATHPRRQQRYADHVDRTLLAPVAGDTVPIELAIARIDVTPGLPSRLVSAGVRLGDWIKTQSDTVSEWLRTETQTLEAEAMYTESILFEPTESGLLCWYYMETESMERLYDAYDASTRWEVRFSDWVMRRVFEHPQRVVEYPLETECEVLIHAVHPDRP